MRSTGSDLRCGNFNLYENIGQEIANIITENGKNSLASRERATNEELRRRGRHMFSNESQ